MADAPLMLSVSGMRGIVGESLTPDVAARFAAAFAHHLIEDRAIPRPRIVLARDGRAGGEHIRDAAARGLAALGCQIIDIDVAMTPTVGVAVDHLGADGALTATASHNPQEWNGLKAILAGNGAAGALRLTAGAAAADATAAAKIIQRFHALTEAGATPAAPPPAANGEAALVRELGATLLHVDKVLHAIGPDAVEAIRNRRFTVVVDSVNASGVRGTQLLMDRLGCTLHHVGGDDSGIFPHTPEPTRENLTSLCDAVRAGSRGGSSSGGSGGGGGAHVGFAQDPDADRLAIVDERGDYIGEEYTLALAAMALFELGLTAPKRAEGATGDIEDHGWPPRPVTLCANLSTSRMIDDVAARYGARIVRSPVGEANVVAAMREHHAILGGEGNGGVIWPQITLIRDSLSAMALVLALMAKTGAPLSALVAQLPAYAILKRKVELARREDADRAAQQVAARFANTPGTRFDRQDGLRIDFDETTDFGPSWIHIRASNTEPIMRLIAEAGTHAQAESLLNTAEKAIARPTT